MASQLRVGLPEKIRDGTIAGIGPLRLYGGCIRIRARRTRKLGGLQAERLGTSRDRQLKLPIKQPDLVLDIECVAALAKVDGDGVVPLVFELVTQGYQVVPAGTLVQLRLEGVDIPVIPVAPAPEIKRPGSSRTIVEGALRVNPLVVDAIGTRRGGLMLKADGAIHKCP